MCQGPTLYGKRRIMLDRKGLLWICGKYPGEGGQYTCIGYIKRCEGGMKVYIYIKDERDLYLGIAKIPTMAKIMIFESAKRGPLRKYIDQDEYISAKGRLYHKFHPVG